MPSLKAQPCPFCAHDVQRVERDAGTVFLRCGDHRCGACGPVYRRLSAESADAAVEGAQRLWDGRAGALFGRGGELP